MEACARSALLCPCLSRWLPSFARSSASRFSRCQRNELHSSSSSSSSDSRIGLVAAAARSREFWSSRSGLESGLGLGLGEIDRYEGRRRAVQVGRLRISTLSALSGRPEDGGGTSSGRALDRNLEEGCVQAVDQVATGLVSHTVEEPAVSELPQAEDEAEAGAAAIAREGAPSRGGARAQTKRTCYYFSQGLCTLMEDEVHLSRFSHELPDMAVRPDDLAKVKPQPFGFFLVLDLEGMVEILEFPVLLVDAKTLQVVDRFHRFVRPAKMSEERIEDYIRNKYGKWGLERVWHDTAIPFTEVLPKFEGWMRSHGLYEPETPSKLSTAAFVTCGNWDVKTKIPEQCVTSGIDLPPYFNEWINLKDIYFNFYKFRAGGMLAMMKGLKMPMEGTHHVGLDDAHNIARVLQRMLAHGAIIQITAKRKADDPKAVKFTFRFRIK